MIDSAALISALGLLADPLTMLLLVVGIVLGLIIGILPGLGPPIAIALALPFTFYMDPVPSMVLLLGIYSAAIYGGSISAIAVGIPGTGAAIATVQDGHKMFKSGRGGEALGFSLTGSIIGGLFSAVCLALIAPLLADLAAKFGPREYLAISVFGLVVVVRVAGQSLSKGLLMGALGLFLTTWGLDELNGTERYTFGNYHFYEGLPLVPFLVGLFAVSEVLIGAERAAQRVDFDAASLKVKLPGLKTLVRMKDVIMRSSIIGTVIGIIPGEGAAVGAFFAYSEAKRRSKEPEKYGTGIPEGIVAPETANNATVGGALVPTLTLGVPGSPAAAVLLGALLIQGLTPGPKLFSEEPDLMYAIFIGLFLINILMLFIGLIAIRFAAQLIRVPTSVIVPTVLLLSFVGIYSVSNSFFNVGVLLGAGILGYVVRKLGYSIAPLSIGFVLGPILENALRQSLTIADGSVLEFFNTPIGLTIYAALALTILWGPLTARFKK
ncbi:tripartite tricarboxylate transporter permease [Planktotalea sp.]|uniref:tripartite tricarboxylate transporter permease n=1 Tax=Planktotalea sp. TaxID=2029877 RepID=UPI0025E64927|nr:tripartite tricarboxylate transporter permease [Planktotalea sp.]